MFDDIAKKTIDSNDYAKRCMWFPKLLLGSVYLWPGDRRKISSTLAFFLMLGVCFSIEYGLYNFVTHFFSDYNRSFSAIALFSSTMQVILKSSVYFYYMDKIGKVLDSIMTKFWPCNLTGHECEWNIRKFCDAVVIAVLIFYGDSQVYSFIFCTTPLFRSGRQTPYQTSYPFNYTNTPQYQMIYATQAIASFYIIKSVIIGVDSVFMVICCNLTVQYRLLGNIIAKLGTAEIRELNEKLDSLNLSDNTMENTSEDRKLFVRCVHHHQLLLRIADETQDVYNIIGTFQLAFTFIAVSFTSFVFTTRKNISLFQVFNLGTFTTANMIQLYCYCFVATELNYEISNFSVKVFNSNWYEIDSLNLKRNLIFFIARCQKENKFTALKLIPLDYDTFIQVLRTTFSFYTLLTAIAVVQDI